MTWSAIVFAVLLVSCAGDTDNNKAPPDAGTSTDGSRDLDLPGEVDAEYCAALADEEACYDAGCVWAGFALTVEFKSNACAYHAAPESRCLAVNPPDALSDTLTTYVSETDENIGVILGSYYDDHVDGYILCESVEQAPVCECRHPPP